MPRYDEMQPPGFCRWLLEITSWFVPARDRSEWLAHWNSDLYNWWILYQRGEIPVSMADFGRAAISSAVTLRLDTLHLSRTIRKPWFVFVPMIVTLALTGILSSGFPVTWSLVDEAIWGMDKPRYLHENRLFVYGLPVVFALSTAVILISIGPLPLRTRGWRYWLFLCLKTALLVLLIPLLWIEGGAALRASIPHLGLRVLGAGLGLALIFVAIFAYALRWSFVDQRLRCPVCLRRLTLPVTLGSWGSVFDPATTELLCEEGHGSLAVSETETGEPDRWIKLDASWREF